MMRLILLLFLVPAFAFSQNTEELDRRNGFKDIKLGGHIDSVKGAAFKKDVKEKGEFDAKLYEVDHPAYQSIGEVKIRQVEVKTYKDLVYEIVVITDKDTRLMKGLVKSFGEPKYILTTDSYNWITSNLSLTFNDHSKKEIRLRYRCYPVLKMMQEDKGRKIDEIADDF